MRTKEIQRAVALEREWAGVREMEPDIPRQRSALHEAICEHNRRRTPDDLRLTTVDELGVRGEIVVSPLDSANRAILYVHGGAYCYGSAGEYREMAGRISRASYTRVFSLEQRLAPEHPLPAALDDVLTAFRWLIDQGFDPREVALMGDSTGATLALAAAMALRDAGGQGPGALTLLSPVVDLSTEAPDKAEDQTGAWDSIVSHADEYLAGLMLDDPRVSPLRGSLDGLPAMLIQVGTADPVREQSLALADKARDAGVEVTISEWEGMFHRWHFHPFIQESSRAINELGLFLLQRIGPAYVPVQGMAA